MLLKIVAINNLYSTYLYTRALEWPNVFDLAGRFPSLNLDQAFEEGCLEIVDVMSTTSFPGKMKRNRFSFATKYASWHRQGTYSMWDENVRTYLSCLRQRHRADWNRFSEGFKLSSEDWGYPEFHGLMVRFRSHYGLQAVSVKDLDKFLWVIGDRCKG